jgi:adenylosuccinate lyase
MSIFDSISPLDYRYYGSDTAVWEKLQPFLSERALIEYMALVEVALISGFVDEGVCDKAVLEAVHEAAADISVEEVYEEEKKIHHLVRSLVRCLGKNMDVEQRRFIHLSATSHDIIGTAEALRYQEFSQKILLPKLLELEKTLIHIASRDKAVVQIGRTHGQHAVPITFGFTMSEYVARLGERIRGITKGAIRLRGQLSGAVGAYNAMSLVVKDPLDFEKKVLDKLGLRPGYHSTQIVAPEFFVDYIHNIISTFGVLANLADDMRHLQRSEIAEVGEYFGEDQVGSSTMPHKKNPIKFENIKSLYKAVMPRMITLYLDQQSEHQRDLTNSASSRFTAEIVATFYIAVHRMCEVMQHIAVDEERLHTNLVLQKDAIVAEPLYVLLSTYGCVDAHEKVRKLVMRSQEENVALVDLVFSDETLKQFASQFTEEQRASLLHPEKYIGMSIEKTEQVCERWRKELGLE